METKKAGVVSSGSHLQRFIEPIDRLGYRLSRRADLDRHRADLNRDARFVCGDHLPPLAGFVRAIEHQHKHRLAHVEHWPRMGLRSPTGNG